MKEEEETEGELGWLDNVDEEEVSETEPIKEEEIVKEEPEVKLPGKDEVPIKEEEPVAEEPGPVTDKIAVKCFHEIYKKLADKDFIMAERLNPSTCKALHDLIDILTENDGKWVVGRRTMNGFYIQCPIHGYAAMHECYKCDNWTGGKNPLGVCKRDMEDIDLESEKRDVMAAEALEIEYRRGKSPIEETTEDSK